MIVDQIRQLINKLKTMGSFRQFKAIVTKNFQIQRRHFWRVTFWRLLMPFIIGIVASLFTMPSVYDGSSDHSYDYSGGADGGYIDTRRPPNAEENL